VVKSRRRSILWLLLLCVLGVLSLLRWGGDLLVTCDPLPPHADAAIVLQGSIAGQIARVAGAAQLLRQGIAAQAVLSVPKESYWGQSVPDAARAYIERNYGSAISNGFVFCETGPEVNSTRQEAEALRGCIRDHGWRRIVVVTSNYHTRRAGRIWRPVLKNAQAPIEMSVYGVEDPEFQARGWWRKRLWAKTWFYETTKLVAEAL
jgi:uncharacterized SAM-binding protein YcdF (DUF218 family)